MNKYLLRQKLKHTDTMTVGAFWTECGMQVISWFCAVIIMMLILSTSLDVDLERLTQIVEYVALGMALLWCIPIARNTRRRLRDAGYSAKAYLWLLLPVIGWVIFILLMFAKSKLKTNETK